MLISNKSFEQSRNDLKDILGKIDDAGGWQSIPPDDFIVGTRGGYAPTDESHMLDFMNIVPMKDSAIRLCEEQPDGSVVPQFRRAWSISADVHVVSDFKSQPEGQRIADGFRCLAALRRKICSQIINGQEMNHEIVGILNLAGVQKQTVGELSEKTILEVITIAHVIAGCQPSCCLLNVEDAMCIHGPFGYTPSVWDVPIISTAAIPKGTVVSGHFWSHAVFGMRPVRIRVNQAHKMVAEVEAATGHYTPSAFLVAEFGTPDCC